MTEEATQPNADNSQIMNEQGQFKENWHAKYGDDAAKTLGRYKMFDDLVNSHMEQRRLIGKDPESLVTIPADDDADGNLALRRRLNKTPDEAGGYEYTLDPETEKVLGEANPEMLESFKQFAHERGWSQSDVKDALDFYFKMNVDNVQKFATVQEANEKTAHEEAVKALKTEWGTAYEEKTARVQLLADKYGAGDLITRENLHNDPGFIRLLDNIANDMAEDRIKGLSRSSASTPAQIDVKIADLKKTEAYNNRAHPDHKQVNEQVINLYKQRSA